VEPSILFLYCERLNRRRLDRGLPKIEAGLLSESRGAILRDFYDESFNDLGAEVRHFVEDRLLTEDGLRTTVALEEAVHSPRVTRAAIDTLVDRRLLRREERLGIPHLELIHDVLRDVVRGSRDDRRARTRRSQTIKQTVLAVAAPMVVFVVIFATAWFYADSERRRTIGRELATRALALREDQPRKLQTSILLAIEAYNRAPSLYTAHVLRELGALIPSEVAQSMEQKAVGFVKFNADGTLLATAHYEDTNVQIWKVGEGGQLRVVKKPLEHDSKIMDVDFSVRDASLLATATQNGEAWLWRVSPHGDSKRIGTCHHPNTGYLNAVSLSSDGSYLATGGDQDAIIWRLSQDGGCVPVGKPLPHGAIVGDVSFHVGDIGDAQLLATASYDKKVRVWKRNLDVFEPMAVIEPGKFIRSVGFSPGSKFQNDGKCERSCYLAIAFDNGVTEVWDWRGMATSRQATHGNPEAIQSAVFSSPNGQYFATASGDATARVFVTETGRESARMPHSEKVTSVAFSPGGKYVATASRSVKVWALGIGQGYVPAKMKALAQAQDLSTDGRNYYAVATEDQEDQTIELWTLTGGEFRRDQVLTLSTKTGDTLTNVVISPDRNYVAAAGVGGIIYFWWLSEAEQVPQELTHTATVEDLAVSADGKYLAAAGGNDVSIWWRGDDGQFGENAEILKHPSPVSSIAFSPAAGHVLASASFDRAIRFWDRDQNGAFKEHKSLPLKTERPVTRIAFSADAKYMATVELGESLRFWKEEGPHQFTSIPGEYPARAVVSSLAGNALFAVIGAETTTLWSFQGQHVPIEVAVLSHPGELRAALFSRDQKYFVFISGGVLQRAPLEPHALVAETCARLSRKELTREEWQQYLGQEPYRTTCTVLPQS
jgi:WD40 repeat protein